MPPNWYRKSHCRDTFYEPFISTMEFLILIRSLLCTEMVIRNFPQQNWNRNILLMKFSSLAALKVVKMTTFSVASDENFIKMICSFQRWNSVPMSWAHIESRIRSWTSALDFPFILSIAIQFCYLGNRRLSMGKTLVAVQTQFFESA